MKPCAERHRRDRGARGEAALDDRPLMLFAEEASAVARDALRLYRHSRRLYAHGVHYRRSGHSCWRQATQPRKTVETGRLRAGDDCSHISGLRLRDSCSSGLDGIGGISRSSFVGDHGLPAVAVALIAGAGYGVGLGDSGSQELIELGAEQRRPTPSCSRASSEPTFFGSASSAARQRVPTRLQHPPFGKLGVADARNSGTRPDAADPLHSPAVGVLPMPEHDLALELCDLLIEMLHLRQEPAQ